MLKLSKEGFYKNLPKNGKVAEIGVLTGENAKTIIRLTDPSELVLVDLWAQFSVAEDQVHFHRPSEDGDWDKIRARAEAAFAGMDRVKFVKAISWEAAQDYPDDYFDWVYIDASHKYEDVSRDLRAWFPKVKSDGYLCGHDYIIDSKTEAHGWGVFQAVNDFLAETGLTIEFVSIEPAPRYAIKV